VRRKYLERRGSEAETQERLSTYFHTNTKHTNTKLSTQPRGLGWRIHYGVEVTELRIEYQ